MYQFIFFSDLLLFKAEKREKKRNQANKMKLHAKRGTIQNIAFATL